TLPQLPREAELAGLGPQGLVAALPEHAVFIDLFRYDHQQAGKFVEQRYIAFVLAKGQPIRRQILVNARGIDDAVAAWRQAIEARSANDHSVRVQQLVWNNLAPHIPPGTKTLFISPDADLARLPWAALPAGTDRLLLDEFALSIIPHGRFLLEQLRYPPSFTGPEATFVLSNVEYRSPKWRNLPGTIAEANAIAAAASGDVQMLTKSDATSPRLTEAMQQARYVHLATHGYFDSEGLQDEKRREGAISVYRPLEEVTLNRIVSKNPLAFVGMVLADGQVLNGLGIMNLPLQNTRLVTLSACETGLGEYTGGEGVQGLQRAFHVAGCPNVIGSLWNVNDAATAALMAKFYHELWTNQKPPIEALREAQLTIYHHPELIPDLAGERGAPKLKEAVAVKNEPGAPATKSKRAATKLWAAFVLSGVGK
ncbi:MAG TPA: CHAT domain-containing protein, partial [Gemmataceae bacterium]|nr:CHAT domain-containing protein [Gemmataceae bacterium]